MNRLVPETKWLLITSPKSEQSLKKLPAKQAASIRKAIVDLLTMENPLLHPKVIKVSGQSFHRLKLGDYRVFFALENKPPEPGHKGRLVVIDVLKRDESTYRF